MVTLRSGPALQPPSTATPGVAIPESLFAGESEALQRIGANIRQGGATLGSAALRKQYVNQADQYEKGQLAYEQFATDSAVKRASDTDYASQALRFNQSREQFSSEYLAKVTNNRAKERLTNYFGNQGARDELSIFSNARRKMIGQIDARQPSLQKMNIDAWLNEVEDGPKDEIRADYVQSLNDHVKSGVMTREWADEQLRRRAFGLGTEAIKRNPEVAQELIEGGDVDVLMSAEDLKLLAPEDIDRLRAAAKREVSFRKYEASLAEDKAKAEAEEQIWDVSRTGDVNGVEAMVDAYPFDADWKKKQVSDAHIVANRLQAGKTNPYNTISDPKAHHEMYMKALTQPDLVKVSDLSAGVPGKWGHNQFKEMKNLLTSGEDDVFRQDRFKRAVDGLWNLHSGDKNTDILIEDFGDWDRLDTELKNWIKKNPESTAEEFTKFRDGLLEPYVKDGILKWLKGLFIGDLAELGKATKGKQKRSVGDVIDVRGKKYKVVSIRESDGEPMVEPVE